MQLHLSQPSDLNLNRHVSVPPPLKINRPNSQKKKEANLGHTDFWYFNSNCDLREVKHQKTLKKSSLSLSLGFVEAVDVCVIFISHGGLKARDFLNLSSPNFHSH